MDIYGDPGFLADGKRRKRRWRRWTENSPSKNNFQISIENLDFHGIIVDMKQTLQTRTTTQRITITGVRVGVSDTDGVM
jgi:hypothetical protein